MPTVNKVNFALHQYNLGNNAIDNNPQGGFAARTARFRSMPQQNMSMPFVSARGLKQDMVSFSGKQSDYVSDAVMTKVNDAVKKFDDSFFLKLRDLCKDAEDSDLSQDVDGHAQKLKGKAKDEALLLLDLIEKDDETYPLLKQDAKHLKERVGIDSD
jgi:hypothetical protein